jgi:hypothetical protein
MERALKKTVLPPNSAVVVTKKQFVWISSVSHVADTFPQRIELSVVSKLTRKPIALVDVYSVSRKPFTNEEKTFIRDAVKPKVSKIASSIMEMSFKLILKDKMLMENNLSENELTEHYPSIPQWVILFNNSEKEIELAIPERFNLPNIISASLV